MSKLPLKVKIGVRDYWDKPDTRLQKSISALKQLVGIDVELEPDWRLLLAELRDLHPDLETFVPSVATAAEAFCLALTAQLDEEGEWSNTFLETVGTRIKAFYGVGLDDVSLSWDATRTGFVLTLPKSRIASLSELEAVHKGVLLGDCFSDKPKHEPTSSDRTLEDWDDVAVDRTTSRPSLVPGLSPVAPVRRVVDRLPDLALLTRPDELLREPPYHLSVYASHGTVELHGSHSPTLELIAAYLNKFVRSNRNLMNNHPCVTIKLHQSSFGPGIMYDKLTMEVNADYFTASPMIVLSLIEARLGYEPVEAKGSSWTFRKDTPFKR